MIQNSDNPSSLDRDNIYEQLCSQAISLIKGESDLIANMANISALIKEALGFHWVGFYLVKNGELVLGPFQGPIACTRIALGKGVCGTAWAEARTIVVEDVEKFPGHIACSALSRSEIVIPMKNENGEVIAVLDIDSSQIADLGSSDQSYLERIVDHLMKNEHTVNAS